MNKIKETDKKNKRPMCKNCGSGYIYITKAKIVCRRCGYVEKKENAGSVTDA